MNRKPSLITNVRFYSYLIFAACVLVPLAFKVSFLTELQLILGFLFVILIFNIMIIVHELGHFWAALLCGMKVEKFAIWFGPSLWKKTVNGVEYSLGTIPAGGYVALPQMANPESLEGKSELSREDLPVAAPYKKIIVAFAGPLFSFLLAVVLACVVWVIGKPVSETDKTTVIGFVDSEKPAAKAGVFPGDKILSIDGKPVNRFNGMGDGIKWLVLTSTEPTIDLEIDRSGQTLHLKVTPETDPKAKWWERTAIREIGIEPAMKVIKIKEVKESSPAALAGLKAGDQVLELNGSHLYSWSQIPETIKIHPDDPLKLKVQREDGIHEISVLPVQPVEKLPEDAPKKYIGAVCDGKVGIEIDYPYPWESVYTGANLVRLTVAALITPHTHVGPSQLSGPIGIMNLFSMLLLGDYAMQRVIWVAVIININLAIMNLLPFPVLDGGHITMAILEMIRRRPLSMSILEPLQTACALALFGFILFVTFYDLQDSYKLVRNIPGAGAPEIKFADPNKKP